jgi:hypothetical protein
VLLLKKSASFTLFWLLANLEIFARGVPHGHGFSKPIEDFGGAAEQYRKSELVLGQLAPRSPEESDELGRVLQDLARVLARHGARTEPVAAGTRSVEIYEALSLADGRWLEALKQARSNLGMT